jgi:hypothetical protein
LTFCTYICHPFLHAEPLLLTHFSEESLHFSLKLQGKNLGHD